MAVGEGRGDDPPLPPPSQQLRFRSAEGVSCAPSFQKRVSSYTNTLYSVKVGVHLNAYTQTSIMHIDITIYIHIYEYTKTHIDTCACGVFALEFQVYDRDCVVLYGKGNQAQKYCLSNHG